MTIEETRKRILQDDDFVLSELRKIQELFKMKKVIRYHHTREEVIDTESVAEHVYGMMVLVGYFLPLEDQKNESDFNKIQQMALYHDIDEIETGDTIGYMKTKDDIDNERKAQDLVVNKLPSTIQNSVRKILDEYDEQETFESMFTKAVDKVEPVFHLFTENGLRICKELKPTRAQHQSIKDEYTKSFPCIYRFQKVTEDKMEERGYYTDPT